MTFHMAGFFVDLSTVANTNVPPIADNMLVIQNNAFLPDVDFDLILAAVFCDDLDRVRLVNPSMRVITLPFVRPINGTLAPANLPGVADYRDNPFKIRAVEELSLEATNAGGVGPDNLLAVIALRTRFQSTMRGDIFTMRGTGTTTVTANAWTETPITWADTLPVGTYAVLGLEAIGATAVAARINLSGQKERPGCIAAINAQNNGPLMFRKGRMGEWGRFQTFTMPRIDFLCNAADTVQTVYLDLMRVA